METHSFPRGVPTIFVVIHPGCGPSEYVNFIGFYGWKLWKQFKLSLKLSSLLDGDLKHIFVSPQSLGKWSKWTDIFQMSGSTTNYSFYRSFISFLNFITPVWNASFMWSRILALNFLSVTYPPWNESSNFAPEGCERNTILSLPFGSKGRPVGFRGDLLVSGI